MSTYAFALQLLIYRCSMMRYLLILCIMRDGLMGFVFFVDVDAKAHLAVFLFASGGRRDCKCGRVNIILSSSFECTDCFQCGIMVYGAVWFIAFNTSS